jgi:hypothetical protein
MICPHHPDRLMTCVAKELAVNRNCLALNLVRPSGEIAIAGNGLGNIYGFGHVKRLAVVQRLEPGQCVGILFDQVSDAMKQVSAL